MTHPRVTTVLVGLATAMFAASCDEKKEGPVTSAPSARQAALSASAPVAPQASGPAPFDRARAAIFGKLPSDFESKQNPSTEARVSLGKMLYFETRLSKNQEISCNSCHDLKKGGVDGKQFSDGHKGQKGGRNSPTVLNAAGHFAQFWDGRAADVEAQAKGPVLNPVEMATPNEAKVVEVLKSIPEYGKAFEAAFPGEKDPITFDNMAKAIAAFERKLVTPSRFDKYLAGDESAITAEEKAGLAAFLDTGCVACHTGPLVGGSSYQKVGAVKPWPNTKDQGRFDVTKKEEDKLMFKVPSLRNVDRTAPYFHDGSVATLDEAIKLMARHQLGKELDDKTTKAILAWLRTLSGELPAGLADAPKLPPSTPKTPKPDKN